MGKVLVLYYSRGGNTAAMAHEIARGVAAEEGMEAVLRTVPAVSQVNESVSGEVPEKGPPYIEKEDLQDCDALIMGSPVRFGQMAAALKYFLDSTSAEWFTGVLEGKPAAVFVSGGTPHGGQESTLLSMMLPLMHHGMLMVGLPFSTPGMNTTEAGGTPYGASHLATRASDREMDEVERKICQQLGQRVASVAKRLSRG